MPIGSPKYAPVTQPGRRAATPHWGSLRGDRPAEPKKTESLYILPANPRCFTGTSVVGSYHPSTTFAN